MSRLRLLLLVAGAGTLLAGLPSHASVRPDGDPYPSAASASEQRALELLTTAARAARTSTYRGTQYVSTWRESTATSSVADIRHAPGAATLVDVRPTASVHPDDAVTPVTDLDPRVLPILDAHYDLSVAADQSCAGRAAHVVEARHPGDGVVAGRFWVDVESGLLLRREIFDRTGRLLRSSAFANLTVDPGTADAEPVAPVERLDTMQIDQLRRDGWLVPMSLAGALVLYDLRLRTHDGERVLHLSYSDGLSTLSLFAQRGRLGSSRMAGFTREKVGHTAVWVRPASPERVVWGGDGRVFTLLSDASPETVRAAVKVLPHEKARSNSVLARIGRGLKRLGSWLNPFS